MANIKKKTEELLAADGDGTLDLEGARKLAVSLEAAASETARETLLALLDADGDGVITWDECEGGARTLLHRSEECCSRVVATLQPYRRPLLCGAGLLSCFYGSNFKYTILFAKTFAATGWPALRPAVRELRASYQRGKVAFAAAAPELRAAKETLRRLREDSAALGDGDAAANARLARDAALQPGR